MSRRSLVMDLAPRRRADLQAVVDAARMPEPVLNRLRLVLLSDDGMSITGIASRLGMTRNNVAKWRRRFSLTGVDGLYDRLRCGRPRRIEDRRVTALLARAVDDRSCGRRSSVRAFADEIGMSKSSVHRILAVNALQSRVKTARGLAHDRLFIQRQPDVAGLYLAPSVCLMALCVDAHQYYDLSSTTPISPANIGLATTGVVSGSPRPPLTLLSALDMDVASGDGVGVSGFLEQLDRNVPTTLDIHLIVSDMHNPGVSSVRGLVDGRPRYHLHAEPSYSAWLRSTGRLFAFVHDRAAGRGTGGLAKKLGAAVARQVTGLGAGQSFNWVVDLVGQPTGIPGSCTPHTHPRS